jgi:uncharacterized protein
MPEQNKNDSLISIKLVPYSQNNEIVGWEGDELKIRINEIPEAGKANKALIAFLGKTLKIAPSRISIIRGLANRHKKVHISGVSIEKVKKMTPP